MERGADWLVGLVERRDQSFANGGACRCDDSETERCDNSILYIPRKQTHTSITGIAIAASYLSRFLAIACMDLKMRFNLSESFHFSTRDVLRDHQIDHPIKLTQASNLEQFRYEPNLCIAQRHEIIR